MPKRLLTAKQCTTKQQAKAYAYSIKRIKTFAGATVVIEDCKDLFNKAGWTVKVYA